MRLEGKVALITGAAAGVEGALMGFGGAAARRFTDEGARVVLTDIQDDKGERSAEILRSEGKDAVYIHLDVTADSDWAGALEMTMERFGQLDVLVNNAGTGAFATVEETSVELWDGQMAVHAKGVFLGTKHAIAPMRKAGGGSIINVSSIYGIVGSPSSAAYHAAKGAIRTFTKAAAVQYAHEGIRVNSVHPGYALTPLTETAFSEPKRHQWLMNQIPMKRFGNAMDIANGVLYLASDESSFMTGAELVIDGGTTAQ